MLKLHAITLLWLVFQLAFFKAPVYQNNFRAFLVIHLFTLREELE
jgi:hypothetical protein